MKIVTILTKAEIITAMRNFLGERIKDFAQVTNIDCVEHSLDIEIQEIAFVLDFDTGPEAELAYKMLKADGYFENRAKRLEEESKAIENHLKYKINEDDIKDEDPHRPVIDIFESLTDQVARVQSVVADVKEAVDEIQTPESLWLAYQKSGKYEDMTRWLKHAAWERLDSNTRAGNWTWVELARITQSPPAPSEGEKSLGPGQTNAVSPIQTNAVGPVQTIAPKDNAVGPVTTSEAKMDPKVSLTRIPNAKELFCSPKVINEQIMKLNDAGKGPKEIADIVSAGVGIYWSERMVMNRINKLKAEKEESCVQP